MARWYQNVLTGEQVEVKTLDEDDFYVENKANWCRIKGPAHLKIAEKVADVEPTIKELKAYAKENGIDLGKATKKDDIKAIIADYEQRRPTPEPSDEPEQTATPDD